MRGRAGRWLPGLLWLLIVLAVAPEPAAGAETVVLPVHHRMAGELVPMVQGILSGQGRVTVDRRTNALVVTGPGPALARVRRLVEDLDRPPVQVRIVVSFLEEASGRQGGIEVEGSVSGDGWKISTGPDAPDGVRVRVRKDAVKSDGRVRQEIVVLSGSVARIRTGTRVPYRQRWRRVCGRYAEWAETTRFVRIDTGFEVRPVVAADRVMVEITPRISDVETGGIIRFATAATRITVPFGQWIRIGETGEVKNEVVSAILEREEEGRSGTRTLSLKIERYP